MKRKVCGSCAYMNILWKLVPIYLGVCGGKKWNLGSKLNFELMINGDILV